MLPAPRPAVPPRRRVYKHGVFFPYRFDRRYRAIWRTLGVRAHVDGVELTDADLVATYGRWRIQVPRSNITGAHITRDYLWWRAVGIRLSLRDDGLTLGTSIHGGVCIHFARRIPHVIGLRGHSALTVTVDDLEGLERAINAGPPGQTR
jgi:hypothetical protein